jgi:uncharacterized repeat protein (TIGR03803 family)
MLGANQLLRRSRVEDNMKKRGIGRIAYIVAVFCVATVVTSPAQTFTTLFRFAAANGEIANGPLVQGANGNFYGTANVGGVNQSRTFCNIYDQLGCGTIFEITPGGKFTEIYDFCAQTNCADGALPSSGLVLGSNGNLYGTTSGGGNSDCKNLKLGCGTVFEITPVGKLTTLYAFCAQTDCTDGGVPVALVQGANGNFYGVTEIGGNSSIETCEFGCGTVFEITPTGKLTTVYAFCAQAPCADGDLPIGLIQASNGNFYGMTYFGTNGAGNVFEITPAGKLTSIYNLCSLGNCLDGGYPSALMQAKNGNLFGTAKGGNNNGRCDYDGTPGCGTVFEISTAGKLISYYDFCNVVDSNGTCTDGGYPIGPLVQDADGNFYGTADLGGDGTSILCAGFGCGTVFQLTPGGQLNTLYTFCSQTNCADGGQPGKGLVQGTNGTFYGLTNKGARSGCIAGGGCGTVFSVSTGLGPFVQANPNAGAAGREVAILGNDLTGTTSVTFNGKPATFTVVSSTVIKATVPSGATTGTIEVTTPSGALSSKVAFHVKP